MRSKFKRNRNNFRKDPIISSGCASFKSGRYAAAPRSKFGKNDPMYFDMLIALVENGSSQFAGVIDYLTEAKRKGAKR